MMRFLPRPFDSAKKVFRSASQTQEDHPDQSRQGLERPNSRLLRVREWFTGDGTAWMASLTLHLFLLLPLAVATLALPRPTQIISLKYDPVDLVEEELLPQEFVSAQKPEENIGALSQDGHDMAREAAPLLEERSLVIFESAPITDEGPLLAIELEPPTFEGPTFSEDLPVQGAGTVGTTGALGAIDRITHEILISLEQKPTLVVWLFDQSGSMRTERTAILKRFDRIYQELGLIEAAKNPAFAKHHDKPLLTAVIGFAAEPQILTPKPTDQLDEITAAIASIQDATSSEENVFHAIAMVAAKYRSYRTPKHGRRNVMMIVFTDEAGDDIDQLDQTVDLCRRLTMPVYVVGRPAPFGRRTAHVKWVDPDPNFDQRPQWVPVRLGPESLLPERLKLYFNGSDDPLLDSGFGPFGLTRLCHETGGLYFSAHPNRVVGRHVSGFETDNLAAHFEAFFESDKMRPYRPDYVPIQEYMHLASSNRARRALLEAARLSWTTPMKNVRLRFPKRDQAALAANLSRAQRAAALLQPKIDRLCQILLAGEADRSKLRKPRWQAGYDLALGRALATQVRTAGYNVMLAKAKQGMRFANEKNNTWVLKADENQASSPLEKIAKKSRSYLQRVEQQHAGTPWALLARRELATPLGWRWEEDFTQLEPQRAVNNNRPPRPPRQRKTPRRPPRRNPPPL